MKKLFLLLLFVTGFLQAQTLPSPSYNLTTTNTLKVKTNTESVTGTNKIPVQETDGIVNYIQSINIPVPYTPTNYSPTTQTLKGQLEGINIKLGAAQTTAGQTARVNFTADNVTVNSVVDFQSSTTGKGTATAGSPPTLSLGDNVKSFFTKDIISILQPSLVQYPAGTYAGQLTVSATPTPNATQQRFTIEIYKTDSNGVAIASGVAGAPIGSLGVAVITILDSGIINLTAGAISNVSVSGQLLAQLTINPNERIKYHVSAQKVGTGGGNVTMQIYYGSNYNSYYDVPVPITTDAVLNKSTVTGITATDAFNYLNTTKQNVITNPITGAGSTDYIPVFSNSNSLSNSFLRKGSSSLLEFVTSTDPVFLINNSSGTGNGSANVQIASYKTGVGYHNMILDSYSFIFKIANSEKARLESSGNLLVNTPIDDMVNKLQVNGSGKFQTTINLEATNPEFYLNSLVSNISNSQSKILFTKGTTKLWQIYNDNSANNAQNFIIKDNVANLDRFIIAPTGIVNISNLAGTGNRTVITDASGNLSATATPPDPRPYKVYTALISQTGTSAPTAVVLENTLGGTVILSYVSVGTYDLTLTGGFNTNKTIVFLTKQYNSSSNIILSGSFLSTNTVRILTSNNTALQDAQLSGASIEIRVYP